MAEMKGIKMCGECVNYDWKKHKCKIGCNDDSDARSSFYGDCPLPDVVPKSKYDLAVAEREANVRGFTDELAKSKAEVTREIFAEIETSLVIGGFVNGEKYIAIREDDYNHYKKKYTGEGK